MKKTVILLAIFSFSLYSHSQYKHELRVGMDLKSDYFLSFINASYGFKLSPKFSVGGGASYNVPMMNYGSDETIIGSSRIIPVYAEAEYRIFKGWISPFVFLKTGIENIFFSQRNQENNTESTKYKLLGVASPGVGISLRPFKNIGVRISYSGILRTSEAWDVYQTGGAVFFGCELLF